MALGDWDAFGPKFTPLPSAARRRLEERNDPVALAAVFTAARLEPTTMELDRVRAPVLAYCGGNDNPSAARTAR